MQRYKEYFWQKRLFLYTRKMLIALYLDGYKVVGVQKS
jgi:hypothetical protein